MFVLIQYLYIPGPVKAVIPGLLEQIRNHSTSNDLRI